MKRQNVKITFTEPSRVKCEITEEPSPRELEVGFVSQTICLHPGDMDPNEEQLHLPSHGLSHSTCQARCKLATKRADIQINTPVCF